MMFEFEKDRRFFAQTTGLMEDICEEELTELGAEDTEKAYRGVYFTAGDEVLYRIIYKARTLSRVLAPLVSFQCRNNDDLKAAGSAVEWEKMFSFKKTFAISSAAAYNKAFTNSLYASMALKDVIADYFRDKFGIRPDVQKEDPYIRFNLFIEHTRGVISLDLSGESLHKRGYRLLAAEAPMQETLAAAIIKISGWKGDVPLYDPMCGSGTLLAEALMHYCRIPAQYLRKNFGFTKMPGFNEELWNKVKAEADAAIRPLPEGIISGTDMEPDALKAARKNLLRLPYANHIKLKRTKFQDTDGLQDGIIVTNPPYGVRLGSPADAQKLFKELGDYIKQKCTGTSAFIYTGEKEMRKYIGLKPTKRYPMFNGKLEGELIRIDSYAGSKKKF